MSVLGAFVRLDYGCTLTYMPLPHPFRPSQLPRAFAIALWCLAWLFRRRGRR